MGEVKRAMQQQHYSHALAYAKAIVQHAPQSQEAAAANVEIGRLLQFHLNKTDGARTAYLEAAKASDSRTRIGGKKRALYLALTRAEQQRIVDAATALLEEKELKPDDRASVCLDRAQAYSTLKQYDKARLDCRAIQEQYPNSRYAVEAKALEGRVNKESGPPKDSVGEDKKGVEQVRPE